MTLGGRVWEAYLLYMRVEASAHGQRADQVITLRSNIVTKSPKGIRGTDSGYGVSFGSSQSALSCFGQCPDSMQQQKCSIIDVSVRAVPGIHLVEGFSHPRGILGFRTTALPVP
jgi:hypothetical protein